MLLSFEGRCLRLVSNPVHRTPIGSALFAPSSVSVPRSGMTGMGGARLRCRRCVLPRQCPEEGGHATGVDNGFGSLRVTAAILPFSASTLFAIGSLWVVFRGALLRQGERWRLSRRVDLPFFVP